MENKFPNRKLIFLKEFLKILEKFQFSIYMNETLKVLLYQIGNFKFIEENYLEVNVLSDSQLLFFLQKRLRFNKIHGKACDKNKLSWFVMVHFVYDFYPHNEFNKNHISSQIMRDPIHVYISSLL